MNMLRATKNFVAPVPLEILDVPGIKKETAFHTSLALGMASSLVLVCGEEHKLRSQLADGDLKLLHQIYKDLRDPIPIQCIVSYKVTKEAFVKSKDQFTNILKSYFPTCPDIKEPMFMNLRLMEEQKKPE